MLLKGFFKGAVWHGIALLRSSAYRHYCALHRIRLPRRRERCFSTGKRRWRVPDMDSFLGAYREIFMDGIYRIDFTRPNPVVLDFGANVGLCPIFTKERYPEALIEAYEADPRIFQCLTENLARNGFGDVLCVNRAVWDEETELRFEADDADGGKIAASGGTAVQAVDARTILARHARIDFLKIDIEGAEHRVLPAIADLLGRVDCIFVELHVDADHAVHPILGILENAGFSLLIQSIEQPGAPFARNASREGFAMQLNVFGRRR